MRVRTQNSHLFFTTCRSGETHSLRGCSHTHWLVALPRDRQRGKYYLLFPYRGYRSTKLSPKGSTLGRYQCRGCNTSLHKTKTDQKRHQCFELPNHSVVLGITNSHPQAFRKYSSSKSYGFDQYWRDILKKPKYHWEK